MEGGTERSKRRRDRWGKGREDNERGKQKRGEGEGARSKAKRNIRKVETDVGKSKKKG